MRILQSRSLTTLHGVRRSAAEHIAPLLGFVLREKPGCEPKRPAQRLRLHGSALEAA
jgi:hypothetical protein